MRPYHVLIFIAAVMACLGVLCWVLPGRVVVGEHELRWPTMAEVMGYNECITSTDTVNYETILDNTRDNHVDIAYYEPYYLKQFIAARSHVKGLV